MLVIYHHFMKGFQNSSECVNEKKYQYFIYRTLMCAILLYHTWVCDMRYICIPFPLIIGAKEVY